jgi:hypothetical protein
VWHINGFVVRRWVDGLCSICDSQLSSLLHLLHTACLDWRRHASVVGARGRQRLRRGSGSTWRASWRWRLPLCRCRLFCPMPFTITRCRQCLHPAASHDVPNDCATTKQPHNSMKRQEGTASAHLQHAALASPTSRLMVVIGLNCPFLRLQTPRAAARGPQPTRTRTSGPPGSWTHSSTGEA